jgi:hypothetical protein
MKFSQANQQSLIVIDDVFEEVSPEITKLIKEPLPNLTWYALEDEHLYADFCHSILRITSTCVDLTGIVGYEFWDQNNTKVDWHYDKDEVLYEKEKILKHPICSTAYYLEVNDLIGGQLVIEDDFIVTPKTNRLVIFSSDKFHTVKDFKGTRVSLLLNPWDHELTKA